MVRSASLLKSFTVKMKVRPWSSARRVSHRDSAERRASKIENSFDINWLTRLRGIPIVKYESRKCLRGSEMRTWKSAPTRKGATLGDTKKSLSLGAELATINNALAAVRILAEEMATDHLPNDEDNRLAPRAMASVLVLVSHRIIHLGRSFRDECDPAQLVVIGANDANPQMLEPDLVLAGWTARRRLEFAEIERSRAKSQLERAEKGRGQK